MSTLRDISLMPTIYKIFSKCICERIKPFIIEEVAFWQRAYLTNRDRQLLIICLKTAIDDLKFYICRGTKTGDPFSSFAFILVIDRVFRPMFNSALIDLNTRNEHKINPLPIKAFADDIAMCAYEQAVIKNMIRVGEPLMKEAGLEVKGSKCAVFMKEGLEIIGTKEEKTKHHQ